MYIPSYSVLLLYISGHYVTKVSRLYLGPMKEKIESWRESINSDYDK